MIHDIPWQLLEKHFSKETNDREEDQIMKWKESVPENSIIYDQLQKHYQIIGSLPVEFIPDTQDALRKVDVKLKSANKRLFKITSFWYGAAASLIIIIACYWFFKSTTTQSLKPLLTILTSDTTTTVIMADGTRVWLNSGSKLEYPETFKATREVRLTGEAYFEVTHDPAHPFLVHTYKNTVKVLGTKFDIRSYNNEKKVIVAVTEGRVSFGNQQSNAVVLNLGQMCNYLKKNDAFESISSSDPNLLAWKTKEFVFDNKPLSEVFQALSAVYHFNYKFSSQNAQNRKITTQFKQLTLTEMASIISIATKTEVIIQSNNKKKNKPEVMIR